MNILSTKICLLVFALFVGSCASGAPPGRQLGRQNARNLRRNLRIALVLSEQHAALTMRLHKHAAQLRTPKIRLSVLSWRKFRAAYPRYDAVIYIALHSQLPSKHFVDKWIGAEDGLQDGLQNVSGHKERKFGRRAAVSLAALFGSCEVSRAEEFYLAAV